MNLRQTRRHFYGNSNADAKIQYKSEHPEAFERPEGMTTTQFLALPKKKTFDQLVNLREKQKPPAEILEKTQSFYNENNKTLKERAKISRPRFHQLEEHELRKLAFTGDSYDPYDMNPQVKARKDQILGMKKAKMSEASIKNKIAQNANSSMETQPVCSMKLAGDATAGEAIDLKKVRDIRWILKRRYLKSRNFQRIFTYWDLDHTGKISAQNIYDMCNKLAINVNPRECEAILATADRTGSGFLGPDDFLDLIYNDVDLMAMPDLKVPVNSSIVPSEHVPELLQKLSDQAKKLRENRHYNQVRFVLKNRLKQLAKDFKRQDTEGDGSLTHFNFERVLKNLNISDKVMNSEDIAKLFSRYGHEQNKIKYREFCEEIAKTNLDADNTYADDINDNSKKRLSLGYEDNARNRMFVKKLRDLDQIKDEIPVVDNRILPAHNLSLIEKKLFKIKRFLGNFFPEKDQFLDFLCKNLNVDKDSLDQTNVNQTTFKNMITSLLEQVDQKVENRILQGFFSAFSYNKFGQANAKDIANVIFDENDKEFYMRVMRRPKGPPPCYTGGVIDTIALEPNEVELRKLMKDPNAQPVNATEDDIIRHIDDKLFIGQKNHFQVYQAFDNDQDGYVSNNDIRNTVLKKNWMEEPDIEKFVEYVDPENKGFVDFRQFSTKIRRNMTNLDEDCKFKNRNIMQPAKEHVLKRRSELERMSQTFTSLKNAYRPDPISSRPSSQTEITGKTRYGNTPGIKNTFLNFQHCENSSPMFMPDIDRHRADPMSRTSYQRDDLERKKAVETVRLENRRVHSQQMLKRINDREQTAAEKYESKLNTKAASSMIYQHKANLSNRLEFY